MEMCRCGDVGVEMEMWRCVDVELCRCGDVMWMCRCGDGDEAI